MKVLITGVAGFIGFSLAHEFLKKNKKFEIYGLDNFDNYYSVNLKKKRISELTKFKKFKFFNLDITNRKKINNFFKKKKFYMIFHFAAQAGVRYTRFYPKKYIFTNIFGLINILDACLQSPPKIFVYASSSSIYGDQKTFPVKESKKHSPKNIYATTKILNESIAEFYSRYFNIKLIGLRFFTVYGEWGRPDMFLLKMLKCFYTKKVFYLNNLGNHLRDFTYIGDVTKIIRRLVTINFRYDKHKIFNLCSSKPISLKTIINFIIKRYGQINIKKIKRDNLDVLKTHGNNSSITQITKYKKFMNIELGIQNTFEWYRKYKIYKY